MKKTLFTGLLTLTALSAQAKNTLGCEVFLNRAVLANQEVTDFYRLVVKPLEVQAQQTKAQLEFKIDRPKVIDQRTKELTKESQDLQSDISRINANIALNTTEVENLQNQATEAEAKGDLKLAKKLRKDAAQLQDKIQDQQKKVAAKSARIEFITARLTTLAEEKNTIVSQPPSVDELQVKLNDLRAQLADQEKLKAQKQQDLLIFVEGANHCQAYQMLQDSVTTLRQQGCNVWLPSPRGDAEREAQSDARRAMGCGY